MGMDNASARNEATDTTVIIQQVANGAFTNVAVRDASGTLFTRTWTSHYHFQAESEYARQCRIHNAT